MPQIHLRAEVGDYAPLVLLPGDPNRATRIAELFDGGLEASRLVNEHRGMLGYTGTYLGRPVSVQTSGMGTPSLSIIVEELLRLGARRLVRVGTTGGIGRGVRTGDLVIATAAAPVDGATRTYLHGDPYAPAADFELTRALVDAARAKGVEPHIGQIATVDVFYNPDDDYVSEVARSPHPGLRDGGGRALLRWPREQPLPVTTFAPAASSRSATRSRRRRRRKGPTCRSRSWSGRPSCMIEIALDAGVTL